MFSFFKRIIKFKLGLAVRILFWRKKPEVIAITGSAGKTTTKEIVKTLLSDDFNVLAPSEGYNTEIGVPLAIFNKKVPIKANSLIEWTKIIFQCFVLAFFPKSFPEKIILEFGADKPGDIKYLTKLIRPSKGVVLTVLPVHLELLKNIENVKKEKEFLPRGIKDKGIAFLNFDNEYVREMRVSRGARTLTFGKKEGADFRATKVVSDISGLSFVLEEGKNKHNIYTRLYGDQMIYPVLAAIAIARSENISYSKIKSILKDKVMPFKGRMNVIEGINGSVIIDDSYNANPESTIKSLEFISKQKGRRIALLGSMNELGTFEKEGHRMVGEFAAKSADLLLTVGDSANKYLSTEAIRRGFSKNKIRTFTDSYEAGEYLKKIIKNGDIVLAKGSQNNVRIERALKDIIKDKDGAEDILVRQGEFWNRR